MTGWQECYMNELLSSGVDNTRNEIDKHRRDIKQADKRTYNGKSTAIFSGARLRVAEDALIVLSDGIESLIAIKPFAYDYHKLMKGS